MTECSVCNGGGFYIVQTPEPPPPPIEETVWALLSLSRRRELLAQYGSHQKVPAYLPGRMSGRATLCLCESGRAKLRAGLRCRPIEQVLSDVELHELWPEGTPQIQITDRLTHAGVPAACHSWTLETFRQYFREHKHIKQYAALAAEWLAVSAEQRSDILIFGGHGTGKTGLAIGMVRALIETNAAPQYESGYRLFAAWRDTFTRGEQAPLQSEMAFLDSRAAIPILVLDEVDKIGNSEWIERSLLMLVDRRQKANKPTLLLLNIPANDEHRQPVLPLQHTAILQQQFGLALYDRLYERAQFWPLLGSSKRQAFPRVREVVK